MAFKDIEILAVSWGNKTISEDAVLLRIKEALVKRDPQFVVRTGVLGDDPQPGVFKLLTVDYMESRPGPHLRTSGWDGQSMWFDYRVSKVRYGDTDINDPEVINRLNRAIHETYSSKTQPYDPKFPHGKGRIIINNDTMGVKTAPGPDKVAVIDILSRRYQGHQPITVKEGKPFPPEFDEDN